MRKERWVINVIILINLLKHMTMLAALKNKKSTNTTRKSDKEESVDLTCHHKTVMKKK